MQHVVYYEPDYDTTQPNLWQLRGHYKYPSILGSLHERARVTILMHRLPPEDDAYRQLLESRHRVQFRQVRGAHAAGPRLAQRLASNLAQALTALEATVVSNLNGRALLYCHATALAAAASQVRYVMRVGGDDLATKTHVYAQQDQAFLGTTFYVEAVGQERLVVDMADAIIAMSRRERARLAAIARLPAKIDVCYRGIDPDIFHAAAARCGPCRRMLFIGRQSAEKGYDLVESAARRLYREGRDVEFTFAGTFAPGQVENRRYVGYVAYPALPALYAAHDAVVMCSRTEGFPQVLMEAMSMGLPCIMSRHLFELDFDAGRTALFCARDDADVAAKISQLCTDEGLYRALSTHSLAHARAEFDQGVQRERYHRILLGD